MAILGTNQELKAGEEIRSDNGFHRLAMQRDGNLVLYSLRDAVWASNTVGRGGEFVRMQDDGNLVMYTGGGRRDPVWATDTAGRGPSILDIQNDRNLVIYTNDPRRVAWASNTDTPAEWWDKVEVEVNPQLLKSFASSPEGQSFAADPASGSILVSLTCGTTPAGIAVCVGAAIVIAVVLEFANGKPPFGPGNDLRVIGGNIADSVKTAGRDFSREAKNAGGSLSDWFKKVTGGGGIPGLPIPTPRLPW